MRFLDGITATRKEELLGQLRAVWTHDSTAIEGNTLSLGDTMFVLQYGLTAIHPFYDGNGRMARLLSNLPVLFAGCPPIVIPLESREDYLKAIWAADGGDLEPFKSLVRKAWQTTLDLVNKARDRQK